MEIWVQNDHHLDLPSCINFLISLCKPILIDTSVDKALKIGCNPLALPLGSDISRLDSNFTAIHSKVQDIQPSCKEPIASASHGADVCKLELCHKWISLLTPENACLSERNPEDCFKEKLRGGLDTVFEVFMSCHFYLKGWLNNDSPSIWEKEIDMVRSIVILLKCLKIMENATFLSKENQSYLLGLKAQFDLMKDTISFTELVISLIGILSGLHLRKNSSAASNDELSYSLSNGNEHPSEKSFNVCQSSLFVTSSRSMDSSKDAAVSERSKNILSDISEKCQDPFAFSHGSSKGAGLSNDVSILLADCLFTAVKVLMNMANENPDGCEQIARNFSSLRSSLSPFNKSYGNTSGIELSAIWSLFVNLVQQVYQRQRLTLKAFEEDNQRYRILQSFLGDAGKGTLKELEKKGTTNVVLILGEGIFIGVDSRLTGEKGGIVSDKACKFRLITSTIAAIMSGYNGRAYNIWNHLSNWVMANNRLPRPTVYEVANAARQYMETHKSMGRYGATMLIVGYDYEGDKLVPYIYLIEDEQALPDELCKRVRFDQLLGKIFVAGSGGQCALDVLNRSFTDKMSVSDATHVMRAALLNSALGDSDSGGFFRVYYLSPRCRLFPVVHTCDTYIERFADHDYTNSRAMFLLGYDITVPLDPILLHTFGNCGEVMNLHSLGNMGRFSFHRVRFRHPLSVEFALMRSKAVNFLAEPICYFQSIELKGPDGSIIQAYISKCSLPILEKVWEQMKLSIGSMK